MNPGIKLLIKKHGFCTIEIQNSKLYWSIEEEKEIRNYCILVRYFCIKRGIDIVNLYKRSPKGYWKYLINEHEELTIAGILAALLMLAYYFHQFLSALIHHNF